MSEIINGTIECVYFSSPGFSAGTIETESGTGVKFRGAFYANVGDIVTLSGKWEHHSKYGRQFSVKGLSYDLPDTPEGLVRYLAKQEAFKGIGEATAEKLVDYAGSADVLDDLIRNSLDELRVALSIPLKTLETLQTQWIECAAQNKVRAYLASFELTPHQIDTLFEALGEGVIGTIRGNPYELIRNVRGYGFKRLDKIALKMGIKKTHPGRIDAGLKYVMQEEIRSGHTWMSAGNLIHRANELLIMDGLDSLDIIQKAAAELHSKGELVTSEQAVTFPEVLSAEQTIADAFSSVSEFNVPPISPHHIDMSGLNLAQLEAYNLCLANALCTVFGGAGTGKAQPLNAKVLTPAGWCKMGDLKVGSLVIGADGEPCKVTGVHPQGVLDVYRVRFTDGAETHCCADHLWLTKSQKDRDRNRPGTVKTLERIIEEGLNHNGKRKHWIPMVEPVEFGNPDLPLDPYVLGLLLGDGCLSASTTCAFCSPEEDILALLEAALAEDVEIHPSKSRSIDYRLCGTRAGHNSLLCVLRDLGLQGKRSHEKFVPEVYRLSASGVRLALLQGLLDTNGNARKSTIEYVTTSPQLAEDVRFLVQSLGGTCSCSSRKPTYTYNGEKRIGKTAYRMHLCLPSFIWPFRLPRKSAAYRPRTKCGPRRAITSVVHIGKQECQCIAVNAANHLYVTDDFIVTHNTHLVGRLAKTWMAAGHRIILCAPTGKAAKRIEEVLRTKHDIVGVEAMTIHRLLEYDGYAFRCEKVFADVVIVDEASMVDVLLMAQLLRCIDLSHTQLILVGDHNQLPPVGPGNILRDIAMHDLIPAVVLNEVVRNAGPIEQSSAQILQGKIPRTSRGSNAWAVVDYFREQLHIQVYLRRLVTSMIPKHLGLDPLRDVQIITPVHKGPLGTREINLMMQRLLQGEVQGRFAIDDKVIQTANDYNLGVMNGTIGIVQDIDEGVVYVQFDGQEVKAIDSVHQHNLELAYCLTAHKAQGSEFPCVVVLCHKSHFYADRNWLYTAVTRASDHVILLGDRWGLRAAARRNRVKERRTLLEQLTTPRCAMDEEERHSA